MDIVILAGGRGTRLSEKTGIMPKPLITIGGKPILWHIMKIYSSYGHNDFIIPLGYKGHEIKKYFINYPWLYTNVLKVTLGKVETAKLKEHWNIIMADTGINTFTQKRLYLVRNYIKSDQFMLTYGDGVADINLDKLVKHHNNMVKKYGILGTITTYRPLSRFGVVQQSGSLIKSFKEKPQMDNMINAGFMIFEREVLDALTNSNVSLEGLDGGGAAALLIKLSRKGKLAYYLHNGFWESMDTYRDYVRLNKLWENNKPWKTWR